MAVRRLAAAALLLALLAGAALWLRGDVPPPASTGGVHAVAILGPGGAPFWNGTVEVAGEATALSALQAAAEAGDFTIGVRRSFALWVVRIGPYAEDAAGGWNFCVGDGRSYAWVPMAADQRRLAAGEAVRWVWVTDGGNGCAAQ